MFPSRRAALGGGDVFRDEYSLEFDGTDDYVTVADDSTLDMTSNLTVSCWAKKATAVVDSGDEDVLVAKFIGGSDRSWVLTIDANEKMFFYSSDNGADAVSKRISSAAITTLTSWNHYAVTYEGGVAPGTVVLYLNGIEIASAHSGESDQTAIHSGTATLAIGSGTGGGSHWDGKISEVAIYNSTLSASQIATLYNGREPYNHKEGVATGNLVSWWRMGDGVLDDGNVAGNGLIADQVNATLSTEKFTAFANGTSNSFDTFSASSTGFTAGADGSGAAAAVTNQLWTAEGGKMAKISFDIVINSGVNAKLYWALDVADGNGVVDKVDETLSAEKFTAFANASSNSFDTFSASSTGFTAGADVSGASAIVTNQLWTAEGGNIAKITFDIVINSGVDAKLYWASGTTGGAGVGAKIGNYGTGSHIVYANVGDGSDDGDYLEFYKSNGDASNITVSNFSVKIYGGNAGILI